MNLFPLQNDFSLGQIDEEFQERSDLSIRNKSVKKLLNMVPSPKGIITTRPGSRYIGKYTVGDLTNAPISLYAWKPEGSFYTFLLVNCGSRTGFSLNSTTYIFKYSLNVHSITLNSPATLANQGSYNVNYGFWGRSNYCYVKAQSNVALDMYISGGISPPVWYTYLSGNITAVTPITWVSAPWSATTYPSYSLYHEGRRWCFYKNNIWASKPGVYNDFTVGMAAAGDAIVSTSQLAEDHTWSYSASVLLYGTDDGEYTITSDGATIFAGDIDLKLQSKIGSTYPHQPNYVHSSLMFQSTSGNYTIDYDDTTAKWLPKNTNFFTGKTIRNMDWMSGESTFVFYDHHQNDVLHKYDTDWGFEYVGDTYPSPSIRTQEWAYNGYVFDQNTGITGHFEYTIGKSWNGGSSGIPLFATAQIDGLFDTSPINLIMSRVSNTEAEFSVIVPADKIPLDMWKKSSGLTSGSTVTGISHLDGMEMYLWTIDADGNQISSGPYTPSSGSIDIGTDRALYDDGAGSYLNVYAGLAFNQVITTWPLDKGSQSGSGRSHTKRYQEIVLKLIGNSSIPQVNGYFDEETGNPLGKVVSPKKSLDYKYLSEDSDEDAELTITISTPANITLGAIVGKVTQDKV